MGTEQVLVGNLAIAAVSIKTILSAIKQMKEVKKIYTQIAALLLGVGAAFVLDANIINSVDPTTFNMILQKVFSGLFIGASSMGIHETTKVKL
jgi:hypothetical protein